MYPVEECLARIARVPLLPAPTPLHPLGRFPRARDGLRAYIKRDDMTGIGPGGNKVRSLEFLLGEALEQGCDLVLAAGPGQSNLCTLAAAACARLGLECRLVHNSPEPDSLRGNLLLNHLLGVRSRFLGPVDAQVREAFVERLARDCAAAGRRPYIIRNGASTGRGALGYTAAAAELKEQCARQGIEGMTLFVPGGNGGVAAGLVYGNALMGSPFRIVVVSVEDEKEVLKGHMEDILRQAREVTGLPCPGPLEALCEVTDEFRGAGWGANTPESARAVTDFARREGIFVENVYNSKVLVGMQSWVERGIVSGPVCYLHTGGFGSLFSQYEGAQRH